MDEIKEIIKNKFNQNSHSWHDYESAKKLIQEGFNCDEYDHLIKFIVDWLGV